MRDKNASILLSFCRDGPPSKVRYDLQYLKTLVRMREKSYIDDEGVVTMRGIVKSLTNEFNLRVFDILALAFIASTPVNTAKMDFLNTVQEYSFDYKDVRNSFNTLVNRRLVCRQGRLVFAIDESAREFLKPFMPFLLELDLNRDEWFTTEMPMHVR